MVLLSPLFVIVAVVIKVLSGGPVFFSQKRIGQYGRPFMIYKFATMVENHGGNSITIKGEDRITPLGVFLRKYKLNELPQLWNIFKGDMCFVGPRPDVPGYADNLEGKDRDTLILKPGLTSPATMKYSKEEELLASVDDPVRYNDEVIYPDKVRLNQNYLQHRSGWLDIKIIIFTLTGKKLKEPWFQ